MLEIILLIIIFAVIIFIAICFTVIMAYVYWGLSIGMAPVLWILLAIGCVIGLVCAIKNACKAFKTVREEQKS